MKNKRTKRFLSLLTLVFLLCAMTVYASAAAKGSGDADNDGQVTSADARLALRRAVELDTFTAAQTAACDMDGDGKITSADARIILRRAVGLPDRADVLTEADLPADAKICYLTFDDGPSANTVKILDILDKYNVKATFFVIWNSQYSYLYKEIVARGHSIALHSYTHDYSQIYRSTDAYFADLQKISDAVYNVSGVRTTLMRFPGGSSNTVSRSYCKGIMTVLTKEVERRGYTYFDWNAENGDATGKAMTADQMVNKAKSSASRVVLLQHDAAGKGTTVQALPRIIEYYQSRGYYLIGLNENSYTAHHGVNN